MGPQLLVPRVQNQGEPDLAAEVVLAEGEQGLGRRLKQQIQQRTPISLAGQDEPIELMRQRKDVVKVGRRQQFLLTLLQPRGLGEHLAFGAMAIPATVVAISVVPALRAPLAMTSQGGRATVDHCPNDFPLAAGYRMRVAVGVRVAGEDVGELKWGLPCRRRVNLRGDRHDVLLAQFVGLRQTQ